MAVTLKTIRMRHDQSGLPGLGFPAREDAMRIKPFFLCALLLSSTSPIIAGAQTVADRGTSGGNEVADEAERSSQSYGTSESERGVNLLRLLNVQAPNQDTRPAPLGGYVRFYVCDPRQCGDVPPGHPESRDYGDDHRNWLSRWLMGRSYSRIITVKLTVTRPDFTVTTPLASAGFQSDSTVGETWNSEIIGRTYLTPYVRVDAETLVRVHVSLDASSRVQSNVSRTVLDVLGRAANLIQPGSQLVTSLNSGRFNDTSEFVDRSISALFAQTLAERATNEFEPSDWSGKPMVDIRAEFPMNRNALRTAAYRNVGLWRIMATPPRISIFSDTPMLMDAAEAGRNLPAGCSADSIAGRQACRAFVGLTVERVLGLNIAENLTLRQSLTADTDISSETARLLQSTSADARARSQSARRLCGLLAAKSERLGLNRVDAAAALWAYAQELQVTDEQRTALMSDSASCAAATLAHELGLR
jgi:hypothetical protein